jgi:hypothetical protein
MMNDYITRIAEATESADFEELKKINTELLIVFLSESFFAEVKKSPYFPGLSVEPIDEASTKMILKKWAWIECRFEVVFSSNPELPSAEYIEEVLSDPESHRNEYLKIVDKVHDIWRLEAAEKWRLFELGQAKFPPWLLEPYDEERVKEISEYEYISLFELAIFIGYRAYGDPRECLIECPDLFAHAISKGLINPRDPRTHLTYTQTTPKSRVIDGKIVFHRGPIDLSWELTPKEAAEFAILKGYPEHLFTDLLSDTPATATKAESSRDFTDSEWKSKNEREFLYRTIGALVLLLIERTQSEKFGTRERPNKKAIYDAIIQLLDDMGFKTEGRGVAIFAKACFGPPSPSKQQKSRDRYCLRRPSRPAAFALTRPGVKA